MSGLTMPEILVEAAFGNGPFDASPTWTDITRWSQAFSTKRGRQHELQRFEAGTLGLTLNNRDGRFSQWNSASPYAGALVPSTPIKITADWSSTNHDVFYGFVDSWIPQYGKVKSEQVISATDAMQLLSLAYLDKSAYASTVISDGANGYWTLGDGALSTTAAGIPSAGSVFGNVVFGQDPGPLLGGSPTAATFALYGFIEMPIASAPTVECWINTTAAAPSVSGFLGLIGSLGVGTNGKIDVFTSDLIGGGGGIAGATNVTDGKQHHLVLTTDGTTLKLYVDGALDGSASTSLTSIISSFVGARFFPSVFEVIDGFIGDISQVATYPTVLTASQVANHFKLGSAGWVTPQFSGQRIAAVLDLYGWPVGMQSLANGLTQVQSATSSFSQTTALSYIQQLEATEQGMFFVDESGTLTFLDRHYILTAPAATTSNGTFASDNNPAHFHYMEGSIVPAADDLDLWTDVLGSRQGGVNQQASSSNASKYGWRSLTGFTGLLQENDNEVQALCQWLLAHYDFPLSRVRQMIVDNTANAGANFPQMLGRKLMDRVTVDWLPLDGSTDHFIQDSLIESIQHDVTQDSWKTTYGLSPAETQSYFILDDPVLGLLDSNRLGY